MQPMKQRATPQWLFHFQNAVAAIPQACNQSISASSRTDGRAVAFYDGLRPIPAEIAVVQHPGVDFAVVDEDELFALGILEVSVIAMRRVAVDGGRFTAGGRLFVTDMKKEFLDH